MNDRPNILVFMTDQMQGRTLEPTHPCLTPTLDRLAARGVRFRRAYTPNAVCSPARASLMTGLLPHNHGVLEVTHVVDDDQCCLRQDKPHWAQRLAAAGYHTGYFGKWHVERSNDLRRFGWQVDGGMQGERFKARQKAARAAGGETSFLHERWLDQPPGYRRQRFYGVTSLAPEARTMGVATSLALEFLAETVRGDAPWCCFVSVTEPHDPYICGRDAFALYDVDALPLPPNLHDLLAASPGIYRKAGRTWADFTEREHREAAACYFGAISEIDAQLGRLIDFLERAGQLERTIVIFTSDHGDLMGAHGLYCKNFSGYEEIYNIPLFLCGPGIASGEITEARVGLHDLCPTVLELTGCEPIESRDARSFAPVLRDPSGAQNAFTTGYAEYHGGRYRLTQRIYWEGPWKFVHNGFDCDELYNLDDDPYELNNLAANSAYRERVEAMMAGIWRRVRETGDHALLNTDYPILRVAPIGPGGGGEAAGDGA